MRGRRRHSGGSRNPVRADLRLSHRLSGVRLPLPRERVGVRGLPRHSAVRLPLPRERVWGEGIGPLSLDGALCITPPSFPLRLLPCGGRLGWGAPRRHRSRRPRQPVVARVESVIPAPAPSPIGNLGVTPPSFRRKPESSPGGPAAVPPSFRRPTLSPRRELPASLSQGPSDSLSRGERVGVRGPPAFRRPAPSPKGEGRGEGSPPALRRSTPSPVASDSLPKERAARLPLPRAVRLPLPRGEGRGEGSPGIPAQSLPRTPTRGRNPGPRVARKSRALAGGGSPCRAPMAKVPHDPAALATARPKQRWGVSPWVPVKDVVTV